MFDQPDLRWILKGLLEMNGYARLNTTDGEGAISLLHLMSEMKGLQFFQFRGRDISPQVPVLTAKLPSDKIARRLSDTSFFSHSLLAGSYALHEDNWWRKSFTQFCSQVCRFEFPLW